MTIRAEEERFLASAERGFLATVGERGAPTVVPVCFVYDRGRIYTAVDRKPKARKPSDLARLTNIATNRSVAFIVDHYSENWNKISYLLVHGTARTVAGKEERARALEMLAAKYPQYRRLTLDEGAPMIAIDVTGSKLWSFGQPVGRSKTPKPS